MNTPKQQLSTSVSHIVYDKYGLPLALLELPSLLKQFGIALKNMYIQNGTKTLLLENVPPQHRLFLQVTLGYEVQLSNQNIHEIDELQKKFTSYLQKQKFVSKDDYKLAIIYLSNLRNYVGLYSKIKVVFYAPVVKSLYGFQSISIEDGLYDYITIY